MPPRDLGTRGVRLARRAFWTPRTFGTGRPWFPFFTLEATRRHCDLHGCGSRRRCFREESGEDQRQQKHEYRASKNPGPSSETLHHREVVTANPIDIDEARLLGSLACYAADHRTSDESERARHHDTAQDHKGEQQASLETMRVGFAGRGRNQSDGRGA